MMIEKVSKLIYLNLKMFTHRKVLLIFILQPLVTKFIVRYVYTFEILKLANFVSTFLQAIFEVF